MTVKHTVFNQTQVNHLDQPLFFGNAPNVARFESSKHSLFEDLTDKQLSFFWRPQEIDLSLDSKDFEKMPEHWKFIFTENLKYQSLLDSVQGRAPAMALLPIVSDVSLENWITTWTFSESIHSRSYTHIMRNLYNDPSKEFDEIILNPAIMKRAAAVTRYYDDLMEAHRLYMSMDGFDADIRRDQLTKVKECLYLVMHVVNALEAIRFYVSFACTFNFAELGYLEGNAKIMKLIARDEQLHLKGTQGIIKMWHLAKDDPEMQDIAIRLKPQATNIFIDAANQEKEWVDHLLSNGSMPGVNKKTMYDYVEYLAHSRMQSVDLDSPYQVGKHPLPWIRKWLNSDGVQVAAQEAELSSYLIGQMDSTIRPEFLSTLEV